MFWDEKAQTVYEFAYCLWLIVSQPRVLMMVVPFFGLEANILLLLSKFYGHQTN